MKKTEIFDLILSVVSDECEVRTEIILDGNEHRPAVVDARMLLVQYLRRVGLENEDIALIIFRKRGVEFPESRELKSRAKSISRMFRSYNDRCMQSKTFCSMSADIAKFVKENFY